MSQPMLYKVRRASIQPDGRIVKRGGILMLQTSCVLAVGDLYQLDRKLYAVEAVVAGSSAFKQKERKNHE